MKKETTTRDRLLESGLKTFSKKGYIGATTREIAGGAGVAEVTLFRHFSSKEKLFQEVISRYSFLPTLKGLLPELKGLDYRNALSLIAERFFEILKERRELVRIVQSEMSRSPKIRRVFYLFTEEMFRALASYFKEMQGRGLFKSVDAELAARAFLGMFFAYFMREEFVSGRKMSREEVDRVVETFSTIFAEGTISRTGRIRPSEKRRVA